MGIVRRKFKLSSKELIESGIFDAGSIIDSEGKKFLIVAVKILGRAGLFPGSGLMKKSRQVKLDFELGRTGSHTVDEFKQLLLSTLECNNYEYVNEIIVMIRNETDFQTIVTLFCWVSHLGHSCKLLSLFKMPLGFSRRCCIPSN